MEWDEIDEKSVTNPDAGVMIWNAGSAFVRKSNLVRTCVREKNERFQVLWCETSHCGDPRTKLWMRRRDPLITESECGRD